MTPGLSSYFLDLGPYAVALAAFAAVVSYRSNPLRSVNRAFAALSLAVALWQFFVTMARVTKNYIVWVPMTLPFGGIFVMLLFLLHDSAVFPTTPLKERLKRNTLAIITAVCVSIGVSLAYISDNFPKIYPFSFRLITLLLMAASFREAWKTRWKNKVVSPYEIRLFNTTAAVLNFCYLMLMVMRTPLGSRINTSVIIIFYAWTIWLLLSERALDANGAARILFGHVLTLAAHCAFSAFIFLGLTLAGAEMEALLSWQVAIVAIAINYPLFHFTHGRIRNRLRSLAVKTADASREAAIKLASTADTEQRIEEGMSEIATEALPGESARFLANPAKAPPEVREIIDLMGEDKWMTPELALRRYRGETLNKVLWKFSEAKCGAVILARGYGATVYVVVAQRAGGSATLSWDEIEFLQNLASIAYTGIARIRAVLASRRAHGLAAAGRVAANMTHEARNQLDVIVTFADALARGAPEADTPAFRAAMRNQAVSLADNFNLSLEIARLKPSKLKLTTAPVLNLISAAVSFSSAIVERAKGEILKPKLSEGENPEIVVDERLLRQVLLNLVQNSVQSVEGSGRPPRVTVSVRVLDREVEVWVRDNGPGIPESIRNDLFSEWTTTKEDGTGLGLAFCKEAMRLMGGDIRHVGEDAGGATFVLSFRREEAPQPSAAALPRTSNSRAGF